jgi:excisionase family DNA binding protein
VEKVSIARRRQRVRLLAAEEGREHPSQNEGPQPASGFFGRDLMAAQERRQALSHQDESPQPASGFFGRDSAAAQERVLEPSLPDEDPQPESSGPVPGEDSAGEPLGEPSVPNESHQPESSSQRSIELAQFLAALGQASGGRRIGLALELEVDPERPSRIKVDVITTKPVTTGRFVTVKQAARLLRVSEEEVEGALAKGELQGLKIGNQWRVCLERPLWLGSAQPPTCPREE